MEPVMTKRAEHIKDLRKLSRRGPGSMELFKQIQGWITTYATPQTDDRQMILVAFTLLEEYLRLMLSAHFHLLGTERETMLFESEGDRESILGTVHSRATMAYCLGFIGDKTLKDVRVVTLIRNAFAHSGHQIDCTHPSIEALSHFDTMRQFGDRHHLNLEDGSVLFQFDFTTSRQRVLSFILFLCFHCAMNIPENGDKASFLRHIFD